MKQLKAIFCKLTRAFQSGAAPPIEEDDDDDDVVVLRAMGRRGKKDETQDEKVNVCEASVSPAVAKHESRSPVQDKTAIHIHAVPISDPESEPSKPRRIIPTAAASSTSDILHPASPPKTKKAPSKKKEAPPQPKRHPTVPTETKNRKRKAPSSSSSRTPSSSVDDKNTEKKQAPAAASSPPSQKKKVKKPLPSSSSSRGVQRPKSAPTKVGAMYTAAQTQTRQIILPPPKHVVAKLIQDFQNRLDNAKKFKKVASTTTTTTTTTTNATPRAVYLELAHIPPSPYRRTTVDAPKVIWNSINQVWEEFPLGPNDVIFGEGAASNNWKGNEQYRQICRAWHHVYNAPHDVISKVQKTTLSGLIVRQIKEELGGHFLKHDPSIDRWCEVTAIQEHTKISRYLRDKNKDPKSRAAKRAKYADSPRYRASNQQSKKSSTIPNNDEVVDEQAEATLSLLALASAKI